ncbi:hypothetical protein CFM90_26465 (plasmid) [Ralstonia solanacearum]|nr:hypothetical protein CFM90_26465 [Ralstonia solanacearum]
MLRAEFDAGGYDLVLSRGAVVRHLQLKTVVDGGQANHVVINLMLALKPSGCVLWIVVDHALNLLAYRWYGALHGEPLPDLQHTPAARPSSSSSITSLPSWNTCLENSPSGRQTRETAVRLPLSGNAETFESHP